MPEQSARAAAFVDGLPCYVTDVVVTETVFVLERTYGFNRDCINELMTTLFKLKTVAYNDYLMKDVFDLYITATKLSFVDCYSSIEASKWENELATFDKDLLKKGGSHVKEPK